MPLCDEDIAQLQARRDEAAARFAELEYKPSILREQLRESEHAGDVGSADDLEIELAAYIGVIEAARFRSEVLARLYTVAVQDRRRAASQAAVEQAERDRRYWRSQGLDRAPSSPEVKKYEELAAASFPPGVPHIDVAGGDLVPPISSADAEQLRRRARPIS